MSIKTKDVLLFLIELYPAMVKAIISQVYLGFPEAALKRILMELDTETSVNPKTIPQLLEIKTYLGLLYLHNQIRDARQWLDN